MPNISVVSPVYNAEKVLPELVERIEKALKKITNDFEIILVEDCGEDKSWEVMEKLANEKVFLKVYKLSRNFGQHHAITCGLDKSDGDWVVVMDCDLQDPPEEISRLYNKAKDGYDIVFARRFNRKDSFYKKMLSKMFYFTLSYLTGRTQDGAINNFGIYNRKVINSVISMRENIRFFPSMVKWVGFNSAKLNVKHYKREERKSSYDFGKSFNLALDTMLAFSDKPLRLVIKFGFFISLLAVIFSVYTFFKWKFGYIAELGYSSIIISIWLLIGFLIIIIGIVGIYVGKIFESSKNRPIYIIDKEINGKSK